MIARQTIIGFVITIMFVSSSVAVSAKTLRFALVVGNDRGVDRQATLSYAERDASRFANLLVDLGQVEQDNLQLVLAGDDQDFEAAFNKLNQKISDLVPGHYPRARLLVYFSGHSDGLHLEFGKNKLSLEKFRALLKKSKAQTTIVFVDACQSGQLLAAKGKLKTAPAFDIDDSDSGANKQGLVLITSGSAGEIAQESSELQGSFFTHHLISALRGAADSDNDYLVTLAEAYGYAYERTVQGTAYTLGGAQHPSFDYDLQGSGQVVLTELASGKAALVFGPQFGGQLLVINNETNQVAAELNKPFGATRRLALAPRSYRVIYRRGQTLRSTNVSLHNGQQEVVRPKMLSKQTLLASAQKLSKHSSGPLGVYLYYGLSSHALDSLAALHQGFLGLRLDLGPISWLPRFGFGQADVSKDFPNQANFQYGLKVYSVDSLITWRLAYSVLDVFLGTKLGVSYGQQEIQGQDQFSGTVFAYGLVAGIDIPLWKGIGLQLFWELGGSLFKLDQSITHKWGLSGLIGVGYQF
jgi:hypothetical protein